MKNGNSPADPSDSPNSVTKFWRLTGGIPTRNQTCKFVLFCAVVLVIIAIFHAAVSVAKMQVTVIAQSSVCKDCHTGSQAGKPFPKILHHTWKNNVIPDKWKNSSQSCQDMNPDYEYMLWTDEDIENLIETEYPWFLDTYKGYRYNIQRADAGRYFILYHYGGVYTDLDIQCRYTFDYILHNVSHYDIVVPQGPPIGITAEVMFAKAKHPYLKQVIEALPDSDRWRLIPYLTIMLSTGPLFLSVVLMNYEHPEQVYVIPYEQYSKDLFINLHGGSWHEWDGDIIFWIYCHKLIIFLLVTILVGFVIFLCKCRPKLWWGTSPSKISMNGYKSVV